MSLLQAVPLGADKNALWEQLFADVTQFHDFRHFKAVVGGRRGPDFTHKESGEGLW